MRPAEKQLTLGLEMASLVYRLRSRMQLIICGTISQGNAISMWKISWPMAMK